MESNQGRKNIVFSIASCLTCWVTRTYNFVNTVKGGYNEVPGTGDFALL